MPILGLNAYGVDDDVTAIQKEILSRGPVEVAFEVYEDFLMYDGGVYVHTGGKIGGGHAVKMLGWGVEQGVPYWLVANSWNTDWGEDGMRFHQSRSLFHHLSLMHQPVNGTCRFFRILRGVDECGIESGVVGGLPKLNRVYKKLNRRIRLDDDDEDFFF
ncbi:unnamed protein product [Toxocara canis]|uniref:Peptidase C1A papain C-terminal domain-containing protein n=1 Tax=Toxocara canis TaxID=6265 RepID=A0A3P7GY39_TOXCA|nr:unnamed protein product [Toxocara canis]